MARNNPRLPNHVVVTGLMLAASLMALVMALVVGCGGAASSSSQLTVTSFSPKESTDDAHAAIQLRFDRPVVSEGVVGQPLAPQPVEVHPAVKVAAHWLDRQTLVVKPLERLAASTRYEVKLKGTLAGRVGSSAFAFVHRPLEVQGLVGVDRDNVPPQPTFALRFNQPVRAAQVLTHCSLAEATASAAGVTVKLRTPDPDAAVSTVALQTAAPLQQDSGYTLRCAGLKGLGGNASMEPYETRMITYPRLRVAEIGPRGDDVSADEVPIRIAFSTPVRYEQIKKHVTIWPRVKGFASGVADGKRYTTTVNLRVSTRYRIKVSRGLNDSHGQSLGQEVTHSFTTGDASPQLSLEKGIYAVEAKLAGYPVWSRNVRRFRVDCAAVPTDKVVRLLTSSMDYDPWYSSSENGPSIAWGKLGLRRKATTIKVEQKRNRWQLHNLRLNERCGGPAAHRGLYLAELSSKEVEAGLAANLKRHDYYTYRYPFRVLANVTNLGVLVKAGTASGLVWVTRISDAKPVPGARVTVYSPRGKRVHQGTTDGSGIARLPGTSAMLRQGGADPDDFDSYRAQRMIVVVEKAGDMAVVDGNWQNGIQIWNFGVPTDRDGGKTRIRGFIQSDRGIYRPGEKVHFKGLVREIAVGQSPRLPQRRRVAIVVKDSRDSTVFRRTLQLTPFGGFAFDLKLSGEAPLGDYSVLASIQGQTFHERFQVEEFRKVTYELELKGSKRHERLGRTFAFDLNARYLFGAPVAGARVSWNVQRRAHLLRFARFSEYAFADYAAEGRYFWYWAEDHDDYPSFISDGEGETDRRGRYRFSLKDPNRKIETPQDYLVQVTATDATDQSVTKRTVITAHKSDFYVGLHAQEFVQAVGMPFSVNTVALSPSGEQVATQATLSWIQERQRCSTGDGYRAETSCKRNLHKVWSRPIAIPSTGTGTERIVPDKPGEYIVRLEAQDARGNRVAASSYVWVIGKGEAFWSGDESARMSLVASKTEYRPGDTARLVPRASLAGATALVTLERNGVIESRVTRLETSGEGIAISIRESHAPNVFASVALVRGRIGEGDRYRPQFKMGVVNLQVSAEGQRLAVELETGQQTYEPGTPVSGKIRVRTADGQPVKAEVSLSVADEGVLQLIAYKTPDPIKAFYAPWGLGIDASTNWNRIARLNDPTSLEEEAGGGDGGEAAPSRVRSRFVNSAFWAPALVTDANGEVSFSFQAPDNLTAFRLMAVAADRGSRFGSGERRITIRKPLLAKPVLPRFLSAGDRATVGVMVHNYTGAPGTATVRAAARGVTLSRRVQQVKLPAEGAVRVTFPARVGFTRQASFTFSVAMAEHSDALRLGLPVGRPMVVEKKTVARGELEGEQRVPVDWPQGVLASDSRLEVTVDRTGLAELQEGLRYLIEYPYGCLEQTLSRFIPLTKVQDLAASLKLRELQGPRLSRFIRAGVAKVIRHQHADGHFSLWPSSPTYPHLTAYALYGLEEARAAGVHVDRAALDRGARALKAWANGSGRDLAPGGETATMAMAAYVLARLKQPDAGLNARLYEARRALPRYGKAFLLRAMKAAGAPAEQLRTLSDELVSGAVTTSEGTLIVERASSWDSGFYMSSDVRSTAIALSALLEVEPASPLIPKLSQGLLKSRRPSGRWVNTQDNLYSLVALADFARQRAKGATGVKLLWGRRTLTRARLTGGRILAFSRSLRQLKPGELTLSSKGKAHYTVRLVLARKDAMDAPVDNGFSVTREYRDFKTGLPLTRAWAGQLVQVRVVLSTPKQRHYVALEDPLPAGFEAVNQKLATSVSITPKRSQSTWSRLWRGPTGWTHQELRDDRVLAFADRLGSGEHVLEYLVRATLPGKFSASPARAEAMYEPEINGRTAIATLEVRR